MTILAVQYLESNPGISIGARQEVRDRLRAALEMLPISLILIGWETPQPLLHICRQEADKAGAKLFRWHPLLTGDGEFVPRPEWQTKGLGGDAVPGFRGMPEFTFVCPNHRAVRAAAFAHLQEKARGGLYDGIFLDRIRFPSPAPNPALWLSCFCEACHEAAAASGLDLGAIKAALQRLLSTRADTEDLLDVLIRRGEGEAKNRDLALVERFVQFRMASVASFVSDAGDLVRAEELEVGLDTFSPSLARLVGQDLAALDKCGEWIKVMSYGHALGPSGLPFETLDLANWLIEQYGMNEGEALRALSNSLQLPLPASLASLRTEGVEPGVLRTEIERGRSYGVGCLLAGMELVELQGVTNLNAQQIEADLGAFQKGGADGLVFSWDLQLIPLERLALVTALLEKLW